MPQFSRTTRYVHPAVWTGLALGARLLLDPILGAEIPYATFYVAVAASAVQGGIVSGLIAEALGGFAAAYFFLDPRRTLRLRAFDDQLGLALYVIVSFLLVLLAAGQRRARRRLDDEIRQRQAAEAVERAQRQRFEVTLGSIGDAVIATDTESRVTFLSRVAAELTGWSASEAAGRPIDDVFAIRNEDTGAPVENPAVRAMRDGRVVGLANHTVLLSRTGRRIPIDDSGAPIIDASGATIGAVLVFRDVSEARQRDAELRAQSRMIDRSHDGIIMMDAQRRVLTWNRGASELYGWTAEEARGKHIHSFLRTQSPTPMRHVDETLRDHGEWEGELIHTCKDGHEIVAESRQILVPDESGNVGAILEINRDITRRKQLETEARRAAAEAEEGRRTLEAVMAHLPEGLTIADAPDVRVRMVSRHGAELAGRPTEALTNIAAEAHPAVWGLYCMDGRTPARPEELPLTRAVVEGATTTDEEWILRRPDGTDVRLLCNAAPIRDGEGRVTGGLIAWRDITQRKRLEEKLRETAKLESVGILAGGIAHDFNNLLTAILGNASMLLDEAPEGSREAVCAEQICSAAERAARLTREMLAYSGRARFVIEPIDLSESIRGTAALLRASIPKNVELRLELARDLPAVEGDAGQLHQVVMNLLINGAESIGAEGGHVTVATRRRDVDDGYLQMAALDAHVNAGWYIELEVTDSGCGMDPQTVARIFDPFFTTKFSGRGLGLSAVQGIVRGHHGAIKVYSTPGDGTTFRILLPACAAPLGQLAKDAAARPVQRAGAGTVLVVDDEESVRATAKGALERLGYDVLIAEDGARGVETLAASSARISLVLLDMTMPGLSGEETLRRMRAVQPDVAILLSSGFSESEAMQRFAENRVSGFLQKPYTIQTLSERVQAATAG